MPPPDEELSFDEAENGEADNDAGEMQDALNEGKFKVTHGTVKNV
jgi:hypothetical protein